MIDRDELAQVVAGSVDNITGRAELIPEDYKVADAVIAYLLAHTTTEWGIIRKETTDPDVDDWEWRRLDDGSGWSNRRGQKYTEEEIRVEMSKRINGWEPGEWRRVVKRQVTDWEVES